MKPELWFLRSLLTGKIVHAEKKSRAFNPGPLQQQFSIYRTVDMVGNIQVQLHFHFSSTKKLRVLGIILYT